MTEIPLISVITINFNNLQGLKKTVKSVKEQSFKKFEYIIIDGNSSDGSKEYLRQQSDRFTFWSSERDTGIYNAMNKGINAARGEYLLFLNSGDHLVHDKIIEECQHKITDTDLIYFNLKVVEDNKLVTKEFPERLFFSFFLKDSLPHPATFIKSSLFHRVGLFDENFRIVSDWKFFMECVCKYNVSYKRIPETLSVHYLDGISADPENQLLIREERKKILNSEFTAFMRDYQEMAKLQVRLSELKNSKKIKFLIQLGMLKKF